MMQDSLYRVVSELPAKVQDYAGMGVGFMRSNCRFYSGIFIKAKKTDRVLIKLLPTLSKTTPPEHSAVLPAAWRSVAGWSRVD